MKLGLMKLVFATMLVSCATVEPKNDYEWSATKEKDKELSITVRGTYIINSININQLGLYQEYSLLYGKDLARWLCQGNYQINQATPLPYKSKDCTAGMTKEEIEKLNKSAKDLPQSCSFPIYQLDVLCSQPSMLDMQKKTAWNSTLMREDIIQYNIRAVLPQIRVCITKVKVEVPSTSAGVAKLSFTILPDGNLSQVEFDPKTDVPKELLDCAVSEIKKIKYKPTKDGKTIEVSQPINFRKKK